MKRRVLLIRNPVAGPRGNRERRAAALREGLCSAGHAVGECVTRGSRDAERMAETEGGNWDVIVSVGGDGTANEVMNGLIRGGHSTALAVAPFGTGNDLAQLLGTAETKAVIRAVSEAMPARVDTLAACPLGPPRGEERHGLLFSGCGLATSLLEFTTPRLKRVFGGRGSYTVGFLRALWAHHPRRIRVCTAGAEWEAGDATVLVVAKARHAGGAGLHVAPQARLDDGLLHGIWLGPAGRLAIFGHFLRLARGTHAGHPQVRCFTASWIEVSTEPPMPLALDGDVFGSTPVRFEVRPRSLAVLALRAL